MHINGLRGRYARIYVQIPLNTPVIASISINRHNQPLLYEKESFLCKNCGWLGHTTSNCSYSLKSNPLNSRSEATTSTTISPTSENIPSIEKHSDWQTVTFAKKKKSGLKNHQPNPRESPIVKVKTFDVVTGKFLNPNQPKTAPGESIRPPPKGTAITGMAQEESSRPISTDKRPKKN